MLGGLPDLKFLLARGVGLKHAGNQRVISFGDPKDMARAQTKD